MTSTSSGSHSSSSTSSSGGNSASSTSSSSGGISSSTSSSGGSGTGGTGSGGTGDGDGDGEGTDYGPSPGIEPGERAHSFYESKYEDGFKGVYEQFSAEIKNTAMANSLNQFKTNFGGGSVPTWTLCPPVVGCKSFEIDSRIWLFVKACILFSAAVLCRSIIFGG